MEFTEDFSIEWDLHELGNKLHLPRLHGPRDPARAAFALALATGDVPANAPIIDEDKEAA